MIFKLHYWFVASGANALGILLGVFIETYTDASSTEIGFLYMMTPVIRIIFIPIICSMADRKQAHRSYLMKCLFITAVSYSPFVIIPFLGPEIYEAHPRFCWYFLVSLKSIGDIAFGGVTSIGDSLAINYAKRIGVDFSVYRVWGTISWMVFGIIVGQINEIWFMPKYVPGFLILIWASLMNMFVVWLWPQEYFVMVSHADQTRAGGDKTSSQNGGDGQQQEKSKSMKVAHMTKSLLPKEVVWSHAKRKLLSLFSCSCFNPNLAHDEPKKCRPTSTSIEQITRAGNGLEISHDEKGGNSNKMQREADDKPIDKMTQLRILLLLLKRDIRIIAYIAMFVCAGATVIPLSFFFMQLSSICHTNDRCDFSQLGGLLQVSMAFAETILFIYIKSILAAIGRLNLVSIAFLLTAGKYIFYGTIWPQVDPYFSLISELPHGIIFGIYLTLMVELGHLFAHEVEYLIPELVEKGVIKKDENCDKLKLSLSATMQALISSANDGFGRGFGALIYGLILDSNNGDYEILWLTIGIGATIVFVSIVTVNVLDWIFGFKLGLDVQSEHNNRKKLVVLQEDGRICAGYVSPNDTKHETNFTNGHNSTET